MICFSRRGKVHRLKGRLPENWISVVGLFLARLLPADVNLKYNGLGSLCSPFHSEGWKTLLTLGLSTKKKNLSFGTGEEKKTHPNSFLPDESLVGSFLHSSHHQADLLNAIVDANYPYHVRVVRCSAICYNHLTIYLYLCVCVHILCLYIRTYGQVQQCSPTNSLLRLCICYHWLVTVILLASPFWPSRLSLFLFFFNYSFINVTPVKKLWTLSCRDISQLLQARKNLSPRRDV